MAETKGVHRPQKSLDDKLVEQAREISKQSAELLRQCPSPDTFFGRKTQEPFLKHSGD